jgi:hypothetical protein
MAALFATVPVVMKAAGVKDWRLLVLELWVRDSEHGSHISSRRLESCSGDVVIDVVVDGGQCLAFRSATADLCW